MDKVADQQGRQVRVELGAATLALAIAVLVYIADRPAGYSMLMPRIGAHPSLHVSAFGTLGQWLPSFVHSFAFSLLTAVALRRRTRPAFAVCMAWGVVNVLFDGQHRLISARIAAVVVRSEDWLPFARPLSNYFIRGTFDPGDIAAAILGAAAAAGVLHFAHHRTGVRPCELNTPV